MRITASFGTVHSQPPGRDAAAAAVGEAVAAAAAAAAEDPSTVLEKWRLAHGAARVEEATVRAVTADA